MYSGTRDGNVVMGRKTVHYGSGPNFFLLQGYKLICTPGTFLYLLQQQYQGYISACGLEFKKKLATTAIVDSFAALDNISSSHSWI